MRLRTTMVPVRVSLGQGSVELVEMAGERFDAPFLEHTDLEHRRRDPPSERGLARLDEYLAATEDAGADPAGLLFGVGRCGSTLLANMLGALPPLLVMKEPQPVGEVVNALAWSRVAHGDLPRPERVEEPACRSAPDDVLATGRRIVRSLLRPTAGQRHLVVKGSWLDSAHSDDLTAMFPDTPVVFVTRPPTEVVASFLDLHPPWAGSYLHRPTDWLATLLPSLRGTDRPYLDPPTLYAHLWRSATDALAGTPAERVLVVDYADLREDPRATLERVTAHLGLDVSPEELDEAAARARFYSKPEPGAEPRLVADTDLAASCLPTAVGRLVEEVTGTGIGQVTPGSRR